MQWLIVIGLVLWFIFGDPSKNIANWLWPEEAAPWETVDAFYYPDRNNLSEAKSATGLETVDECRSWVYYSASFNGDPYMERGDYECGVGFLESFGGVSVYRITAQ